MRPRTSAGRVPKEVTVESAIVYRLGRRKVEKRPIYFSL
jgi:hypothetical protein